MRVSERVRDRRGMTLVEVVIFMFIASTVAAVFGYFVAGMLFSRARISATLEVQENARLAMDRMVNEIRQASATDATSSSFSTDLADAANAGKYVGFVMASSTLSPTDFDVSDGVLRIRQGGSATATPVTSDLVRVASLTFTDFESKRVRSVSIDMTVAFRGPVPGQTTGVTSTLHSTATLRNR